VFFPLGAPSLVTLEWIILKSSLLVSRNNQYLKIVYNIIYARRIHSTAHSHFFLQSFTVKINTEKRETNYTATDWPID